jgi:hypothetical protein
VTEWAAALDAAAAGALPVAGAVLWQSTLLAVAVALACGGLRRAGPAVRYWLWQVVALKLLVMPFWTVAVPWPAWPGRAAGEVEAVAVPLGPDDRPTRPEPVASPPAGDPPALSALRGRPWWRELSWPAWLLLAWAAGVAVQVVGLLIQRRRLAVLLRRAVPVDAELAAVVGEQAGRLGLQRAPRVVVCDGAGSPFVCGVVRPTLVLPRQTLGALTPDQLRQVLLHELAHVRRRDLLWGWLPEVARIVWWFHPVAHWASAQVRLERELACDQLALAHGGGSAADYAETLVRVVGGKAL